MCLLDGSVGGHLWASHEFSIVWTELADGTRKKTYLPIKDIIKEAIHTYAHESYGNIIINDLETCGVELIEYIGTNATMYIFKQRLESQSVATYQVAFNTTSGQICSWFDTQTTNRFKGTDEWPDELEKDNSGIFYQLQKRVSSSDVSKTIGYRATDLTYPGELTIPVGGTIVDLLKKLAEMLGEFEYFYDLQGRFVFQRKKIYVNTVWTNAIYDGRTTYYDSMAANSNLAYDFVRGVLIESFSNTPKLDAIKNDYSVWGKRQTATGKEFNVHLRYAIDKKPTFYHSLLENRTYLSNDFHATINAGLPNAQDIGGVYDWRHLIYLMAKDNLRSQTNIEGLKLALAKGWFHYADGQKVLTDTNQGEKLDQQGTNENYSDCYYIYKYNSLEKKMERIKTIDNLKYCIEKKIFLYGPNKTLISERITAPWLEHMNNILGYDYTLATWGPPWFMGDRNEDLEAELLSQFQELYDTDSIKFEIEEWQNTQNTGYESYYADVLEFWPALYKTKADYSDVVGTKDIATGWKIKSRTVDGYGVETTLIEIDDDGNEISVIYDNATKVTSADFEERWVDNNFWNPNLFYYDRPTNLLTMINPENMRFWIDFLDLDNIISIGYVEDDEGDFYFDKKKGHYKALSGTDRNNFPEGTKFYSIRQEVKEEILNNDLSQYKISLIGRRSKYVNDDKVKAIYFRSTPSLLFVSSDFEVVQGQENLNYTKIQLAPPISNYVKMSSEGKSAKEVLDSLMYDGTYAQESISLSTVPIYYLQPNTRIGVHDDSTNISGEYIIKSFSIPLAYDGMMSITATRVAERIL